MYEQRHCLATRKSFHTQTERSVKSAEKESGSLTCCYVSSAIKRLASLPSLLNSKEGQQEVKERDAARQDPLLEVCEMERSDDIPVCCCRGGLLSGLLFVVLDLTFSLRRLSDFSHLPPPHPPPKRSKGKNCPMSRVSPFANVITSDTVTGNTLFQAWAPDVVLSTCIQCSVRVTSSGKPSRGAVNHAELK